MTKRSLCNFRFGFLILFLASLLTTQAAQQKHLLWRAVHGASTAYLLGSIHDVTDAVYPLPDAVLKAYSESETLAFEVDLDSLSDPFLAFRVLDCIYFPIGDCIENYLSHELLETLQTFAGQNGIDIQTGPLLCKLPWFLAAEVTLAQLAPVGFSTTNAVDSYLFNRGKADGKGLQALETVEEQFRILCSKPMEDQIRDLETALTHAKELQEAAKNLEAIWLSGDAEALSTIVEGSSQESPAYFETLVYDRTAKWLPTIQSMLQTPSTNLVVVGASHLVGPRGLVELLRAWGASVDQLPIQPKLHLMRDGTKLRVEAECEANDTYVLKSSTDLVSWETVSRPACSDLRTGIELPISGIKARFFKLE